MSSQAVIDKTDLLESLLAERILLLDGAMGTQVQALGSMSAAMRGERFAGHHKDLKNFADILCLTHPNEVTEIHRRYLAAGADIVETNTFGASPIGMEEFELGDRTWCARSTWRPWPVRAGPATSSTRKRRIGRGSWPVRSGPRPSKWRSARRSTTPAIAALHSTRWSSRITSRWRRWWRRASISLLPETVIDTLNLKACLFAISRYFDERNVRVPVMVSGTFERGRCDVCLRPGSRGVLERHCALPDALGRHELCAGPDTDAAAFGDACNKCRRGGSVATPTPGLPNEMGQYDLGPADMARMMGEFAERGWVNIVGGCCGTTPDHIRRDRRSRSRHPAAPAYRQSRRICG